MTDSRSQIFNNSNTSSGSLTSSNCPLICHNNKNQQNDSVQTQKNDSFNWLFTNSNLADSGTLQPIYNEQKNSVVQHSSKNCNFF